MFYSVAPIPEHGKEHKLELKRESAKGQNPSKSARSLTAAFGGIADTICPTLRQSFSTALSRLSQKWTSDLEFREISAPKQTGARKITELNLRFDYKFRQIFPVGRFVAKGLTAQRPIVFTEPGDIHKVEAYHYHFWTDPPTVMLQNALVVQLRNAGITKSVSPSPIFTRSFWPIFPGVKKFQTSIFFVEQERMTF